MYDIEQGGDTKEKPSDVGNSEPVYPRLSFLPYLGGYVVNFVVDRSLPPDFIVSDSDSSGVSEGKESYLKWEGRLSVKGNRRRIRFVA